MAHAVTADQEIEALASKSNAALQRAVARLLRAKLDRDDEQPANAALRRLLSQTLALASLLGRRRTLLVARSLNKGRLPLQAALERSPATSLLAAGDIISPMVPRVEFEEAIDDLLTRYPVLAPGYKKVQEVYSRSHAWALAKSTSLTLSRKIQEILGASYRQGAGQFKTTQIIRSMSGWSQSYSDVVFSTNLSTAYSAGVVQQSYDPEIAEVCPAMEFVGRRVEPSRPNHIACVGLIAGTKDQLWNRYAPPAGYRCLLEGTRISGVFSGGSKARYSGPVVKIQTRAGSWLSVTGNHPVLTAVGWVAAQSLKEGDYLLRDRRWIKSIDAGSAAFPASASRDVDLCSRAVNNQKVPATTSQVFHALGAEGVTGSISSTKRPPLDFHGEVGFFHGEIDVVGSYVPLPPNKDSQRLQRLSQLKLVLSKATCASCHGLSRFDSFSESASSSKAVKPCTPPRFSTEGFIAPRCLHQTELRLCSVGLSSRLYSMLSKPAKDDLLLNPVFLSERHNADAFLVAAQQVGNVLRIRDDFIVATLDSPDVKPPLHHNGADPDLASELLQAFPGEVSFDQIVEISRDRNWSGHVYDFQTTTGWMVAEGVVVSNCTHALNQVDRWELEKRGLLVRAKGSKDFVRNADGTLLVRPYKPPMFANAGPDPGFGNGSLTTRLGISA